MNQTPANPQSLTKPHTAVSMAQHIVKHRDEYLKGFGVQFEDAEYCQITAAILGRLGFVARHRKRMITFVPEGDAQPTGHIMHAVELIDGESRLLMGLHGAFKEAGILEELSETLHPSQPAVSHLVHGNWLTETDAILNTSTATGRFILAAIDRGVAFLQAQDIELHTQPVARTRQGPRL
jgi:hypothetical protein